MVKTISWIAAGAIVIAACSGTATEEGSSSPATTAASPTTETTAPSAASTTTIPATTSTEAVTTTAEPTTSTTTTTEPPGDVNPADIETWWCGAFEAAAGRSPTEFAQGLADDFRHGYTDVPAESLEEVADQAALVLCDPEYGQAVAEALGE